MPWRDLTVARACNTCRRTLSAGAHVYQGELTGAIWCQSCGDALNLGRGERVATMDTAVTSMAEWIAKMRAKHGRRDVSARILGEGEE